MKICKKCNHKHDRRQCPRCKSKAQKAWVARNKDHYLEYQRNYKRTRDKGTQRNAVRQYESTLAGMLGRVLSRAKSRTKETRPNHKKIVEFDLDREYLLELWEKQEGKCAISGLSMEVDKCSLKCVSLDRVDSNGGYNKSNVQLVCKWANLAKRDYSNTAMLELLDEIRLTTCNTTIESQN